MDDHQSPDGHERDYERYVEQIEGTSQNSRLHTGGLLEYPLHVLISEWLDELKRLGLAGTKDGGEVDVPPARKGVFPATTKEGRKVWVRPGAYLDEDGNSRSEVRDRHSRTDGAILSMLSVLEGAEVVKEGKDPERALMKDYGANSTRNERLFMLAEALAEHRYPDLMTMSKVERKKIVVGFAMRLSEVASAVRRLQEYAERGYVSHGGDPSLDVAAAELRAAGLSWVQVGQRLGIAATVSDTDRSENQKARKAANRGNIILGQLPERATQNRM